MAEMYNPPGLTLPYYFLYYKFPGKMVATSGGGAEIWRFSGETGGWEPRNDIADDILHGTTQEVSVLTPEEFVQRTERARGRYLQGEGPVYALYDTIRALEETADARTVASPTASVSSSRVSAAAPTSCSRPFCSSRATPPPIRPSPPNDPPTRTPPPGSSSRAPASPPA